MGNVDDSSRLTLLRIKSTHLATSPNNCNDDKDGWRTDGGLGPKRNSTSSNIEVKVATKYIPPGTSKCSFRGIIILPQRSREVYQHKVVDFLAHAPSLQSRNIVIILIVALDDFLMFRYHCLGGLLLLLLL